VHCRARTRLGAIAAAILVLTAVGCDSGEKAGGPAPTPGGQYLVYDKLTGKKGIWIAEADGSRARFLVPGEGPEISPDGKWVAYSGGLCEAASSCSDTLDVVSTAAGAKPRQLGALPGWPMTWSPDSKAIVTARALSDTEDRLVRIDLATGKEVTLARGRFWGWSFSPDGKRIVFARAHGQAPGNFVFPIIDLYVTGVDGHGDPRPITDTGDSAYPVWGPKSIAFARLIPSKQPSPNTEFAKNEIWRIQSDGTGRTTISGPLPERFVQGWHCTGLEPIDWSDDGRALLAALDCEGVGRTVAVDPQTGAIRSLGQGTFTVALSQDAHYALVQWGDERVGRKNERVLIYPYATGKPKLVASGASSPSWNR
jgi:Tol biopolymer transport system component